MDIDRWRAQIDEIDAQLVRLLNERATCAVEIGRIKRKNDEQLYDPKREQRVLERVTSMSTGPLTAGAVRRLFERIIDESRRLERMHAERDGVEPTDPPEREEPRS
jgi:chorismate mutase